MERRLLGLGSVPDCGLGHSTVAGGGNTSPVLGRHSYQKWAGQTPPSLSPRTPGEEGECSNPHPEWKNKKPDTVFTYIQTKLMIKI